MIDVIDKFVKVHPIVNVHDEKNENKIKNRTILIILLIKMGKRLYFF
jgi:hypothetical protein